ncbi:Secretory immunoglobulin A-binding protein EsiB [Thalassocella blandensis]|nr:Secretory immunoglobulin A-binding protein EsiB [Thalassocella blandensis]
MNLIKALSVILMLSILQTNAATIEESLDNYAKGEFETAYQQFMELVELGNENAMFNIGVMHVRGEHVEKDNITGYAWIKLALDSGHENDKILDIVARHFTQEDHAEAIKVYDTLLPKYGKDVFVSKYVPTVDKLSSKTYTPARIASRFTPKYPKQAAKAGLSGFVDLQFSVAEDGTTRHHTVLIASNNYFKDAAVDALKKSIYIPAQLDGRPTIEYGRRFRFNFQMHDAEVTQENINKTLAKYKAGAEAGSSADSYLYAYTISILSSLTSGMSSDDGKDFQLDNPTPWFVKSAQRGYPLAKYELGKNALYGNQCDVDNFKSHFWLEKSANDGVPDAQLILGLEYLYGTRYKQNKDKAIELISLSADSGLSHAQLLLAWIYATAAERDLRQPQKALAYFNKIERKEYVDKVSYYETQAAVYAANSDFDEALKWQNKAIKAARKLQLPLTRFENASQRYQQKNTLQNSWLDSTL